MAKVLVSESHLQNIGEAIRSKLGGTAQYTPAQMASAISSIEEGYPEPTGTVNISQNGTTNVKDCASANVNVPNSYSSGDEGKVVHNGSLVAQSRQTITKNGTYDTTLISELIANISGGEGESGGGSEGGAKNILGGTSEPTSNDGYNGDIYIKYIQGSEEYTPVEYISNSAVGSYIDTGYLFKANSRIEADVNISGGSTYPSVFGCRTNTSGYDINQWYFATANATVYYAMGGDQQSNSNSWGNNKDVHISAQAGKATLTGEINRDVVTYAQSGEGTLPLYLFGINYNNSLWSSGNAIMKLYRCKIYEGNSVIHDFIPAIKNSNEDVGLYDIVTNTFYSNQGTGSFVAGNEIEGSPIDCVYLKENGLWILLENGDWDDVNTLGGEGDSYPVIDAIFDEQLSGYGIQVTHEYTFVPASNAIEQACNNYFTTLIASYNQRISSGGKKAVELTENISKMNTSDFANMHLFNADGAEYAGLIYGSALIDTLGLVLLGDFSQGGNASNNALSDSINNYSGVILQGIYQNQRSSQYNTSCLYQDIELEVRYWAGMKDRNVSYNCGVTFTDNQTVSLNGNKQVIIYGIP